MSKNRIKTPLLTLTTRDEAEAVMNELALAANNRRKFTAGMDKRLLEVKAEFEPIFSEIDAAIAQKSDALRVWAESHPEEFGKKKSIDFLSGTLGFRTGTPKLALLNRSWNWAKVLEAALVYLPNFIRQKPELDKEQIIAQREELEPVFHRVGVKVVQEESFYIEPKLTDPQP